MCSEVYTESANPLRSRLCLALHVQDERMIRSLVVSPCVVSIITSTAAIEAS